VTSRWLSIRAAWSIVAVMLAVGIARADEGWLIERMVITLAIQPDGAIDADEAIDVDFNSHPHHGIFRDIRYQVFYDADRIREYDIALKSVTTADGRPHQVRTLTNGALRRFQIGDPKRTITGKETYRLAYRIGHALNAFPDHDELYWNATGVWPIRITTAVVIVTAPGGAIERVQCFQGPAGSREPCRSELTPGQATYTATRPLADGEQLTIVTGLRKGAVPEPTPKLVSRPREVTEYFTVTPVYVALAGVLGMGMAGGLGALWWSVGRDRRFVALQHSPDDRREETVPLFRGRPIAVEFEPPDAIRPAQMGLLLDERADTLDVTATIIDLAVRGYLRITEIPKQGWFGHKDWQLDRLKAPDASLLEYERIVLDGLFVSDTSTTISDLKKKFYTELQRAQAALYRDAVTRGWFPKNPSTIRGIWRACGVLVALVGVVVIIYLGRWWGAGLLGVPVVAGGGILMLIANAMPRRTAAGRTMLQRTLGFVRYMKTAETRQQAFAERANIFTAYLPYAIAFRCVDQWAHAFRDIDMQQATGGWYVGGSGFQPSSFSSAVGSFSSSVSSAIASTPGGSGGSGFGGGGSSGGGGGGGGGGGW
jgi:uncharacterized protein (TIGR04222 family)